MLSVPIPPRVLRPTSLLRAVISDGREAAGFSRSRADLFLGLRALPILLPEAAAVAPLRSMQLGAGSGGEQEGGDGDTDSSSSAIASADSSRGHGIMVAPTNGHGPEEGIHSTSPERFDRRPGHSAMVAMRTEMVEGGVWEGWPFVEEAQRAGDERSSGAGGESKIAEGGFSAATGIT